MQVIAGDDFVQQMEFSSIQSFQRLATNLHCRSFGKMSGEIVAYLLSKNKNTRLVFTNRYYLPYESTALALRENTTLTVLDLSNNGLGDFGAMAILHSLMRNNTLDTLNLGFNNISDGIGEDVEKMLLSNSTLRTLSLEGNHIRNGGGAAIAGALERNTTSQIWILVSIVLDYFQIIFMTLIMKMEMMMKKENR